MTFAQPWLLAVAGIGILGVTVLHLLSWQRPRPQALPTARFLPPVSARTRWRAFRPSDLMPWLLRVAALGAIGVAAAGPMMSWGRSGSARVLVVDGSRAVASVQELRDSVARLSSSGTPVLVRFDSVARVVTADSISELRPVTGQLAAGLVAGVREATALASTFADVELVVVSPYVQEEWSPALRDIARTWPGAVRLVRVAPARPVAPTSLNSVLPPASDPVGAALRLASRASGVRVQRGALGADDSLHAQRGGVLVHWPRLAPDTTVRALAGAGRTVIGSLSRADVLDGSVLWRWSDGASAATERALGQGCMRSVGVGLPEAGDLAIRPGTVALAATLLAPCGRPDFTLATDTTWWHGATRGTLAIPSPDARLQRALYALALLLLLLEWRTRRRVQVPEQQSAASLRRAA